MKIVKDNGPMLSVQCGQCLHLKVMPDASIGEVCSKLGVKDFARPCAKFQANWQLYNFSEGFSTVLKNTDNEDLPGLVALVNAEIATRKAKFRYGMIVYIRIFGDDFISNYVKCHVLSAKSRYVYVQNATGKYYGAFLKKNVYKEPQFFQKIQQLALEKKYRDPKLEKYTDWRPIKRGSIEINEIPTIEKVMKEKDVMTFSVNSFREDD